MIKNNKIQFLLTNILNNYKNEIQDNNKFNLRTNNNKNNIKKFNFYFLILIIIRMKAKKVKK